MDKAFSDGAPRFSVEYLITVFQGQSIDDHARDIAIEQTVEIPLDCIPQEHFRDGIVGNVESIYAIDGKTGKFTVEISYRCDSTGFSVPQFLNVLFGNISLKNNIRVTNVDFPDCFRDKFPGPAAGIDGLRKLTGVYGRPLACTALKPMGLPVDRLAAMAGQFALGGIDFIKDDHGITDQQFHPFRERVERCAEAVSRANESSGGHTLYFPSVCGRFDEIEEQVRFAVRHGIRGILVAPMLVGFDTVRYLSEKYRLIIMGHPALTGAYVNNPEHGIAPGVLLGTIFRMIGADISVFPNWGGRFPFTREDCNAIATALREPLHAWKRSFPSPAGGMNLERLDVMNEAYGSDTMLLIGGALVQMSADLRANTTVFMEKIRSAFAERIETPQEIVASSCDWSPPAATTTKLLDLMTCRDYHWQGRTTEVYKDNGDIAFQGIVRSELVGRFGENTRFDLRYFEIEPQGFSSYEKHIHEHVIIGVRGKGVLIKGGSEYPISLHDIGYVSPLEAHQLRNDGTEPFGFFCIVDHERDRPVGAA